MAPRLQILKIQRALCLLQRPGFHGVGVNHGGLQICVAEQFLNGPDVVVGRQQMAGEAVAQSVRRGAFGDLSFANRPLKHLLKGGLMHMVAPQFTGAVYFG